MKYIKYIRLCALIIVSLITVQSYAIELVSKSSNNTQANGDSGNTSMNYDGSFVVFLSSANNLFTPYTGEEGNVYLRDRVTGQTELISAFSSTQRSERQFDDFFYNYFTSIDPISDDGRYVTFSRGRSSGSTQITGEVYLRDRILNQTKLISKSYTGGTANGNSFRSSISADGLYIVFSSQADNLVENDLNGQIDIFLYNLQSGSTQLISASPNGTQANGRSDNVVISDDGMVIAFISAATNLVNNDTNNSKDVFVYNRLTNTLERVNVSSQGEQANVGTNGGPISISSDGRFVSFYSDASNLIPSDTNNISDIFIRDRQNETTTRVSVSTSGQQANGHSYNPSISNDGRFVSFHSDATNLVAGDTNDVTDVFVRDLTDLKTARVNLSELGEQGIMGAYYPYMSGDGFQVSFHSEEAFTNDATNGGGFNAYVTENPLSPNVQPPQKLSIEKTINGELSIVGGTVPLASLLVGRHYRADYTVTNTSTTRVYGVKVFDKEQGDLQPACNLYALAPGQSTHCHRFYQAQPGSNAIPARVEAKISGEGTLISATTPQIRYVGQDALSGRLMVKHALNNESGDDESTAVMLTTNTDQSWLFKVTNNSNIDVYKVKVYNDGVFPLNTGWEELCLIGRLKVGETRYCKRTVSAGQAGLNLMMGRAQGNDSYRVGFHQYINAANPTYYIIE